MAEQKQIWSATRIAGFIYQYVEPQAGKIVCHRINLWILFLINDLQVAFAGITGLRTDRTFAALKLMERDFFVGVAGGTGRARYIPFCVAQAAMQIAQIVDGCAKADDAGDRQAAAARADTVRVNFL
jgi:hypothetical protein